MRLTISTCTAWLTNSTSPTLTRWRAAQRRPVVARLALEPARLARDADERGRREPRSDEEADHRRRRRSRSASPKMSHISSVVNESRAKIASSGTAFASSPSEERELAGEPRRAPSAGSPAARRRRPRRSAPAAAGWRRSWSRRCRAGRRRSAAAAPAGRRSRRARSCRAGCGIARAGRPWSTLTTAMRGEQERERRRAIASRFCHQVQSSWPAPSSSARKTSPSSGAARLKTSVEAEKPSTNSGRPARRNCRS